MEDGEMSEARGRLGRFRRWVPPWTDAALALVLLLSAGGVAVVLVNASGSSGGRVATTTPSVWLLPALTALLLLETLPLAFRRVYPVPVLVIVTAASVLLAFPGRSPLEPIVLFIALYSVAAHTDRRVAIRAGLATLAVVAVRLALIGNVGPLEAITEIVFLALGWMVGAYLGELRGRAERIRREQENEKRRAVAEEQARISRELHDVMAHSLSVMVVQAAAAGDVFETSPQRAREALRSIESAGRLALGEIRRVLDVVKPIRGDAPELEPRPGLSRLGHLLDEFRAAGLAVTLTVEGTRPEVPEGIDLSAYRIVQEALTNCLKHASGVTRATVLVRHDPDSITVDVCDDGVGATPPSGRSRDGIGRGLIGMRERVALYGGDLVAGPRPGGGFAVRARFPLGSEPG
jgi:signal transduction histidine kinase